jgi:hypothetical protein
MTVMEKRRRAAIRRAEPSWTAAALEVLFLAAATGAAIYWFVEAFKLILRTLLLVPGSFGGIGVVV